MWGWTFASKFLCFSFFVILDLAVCNFCKVEIKTVLIGGCSFDLLGGSQWFNSMFPMVVLVLLSCL